MIGFRIWNCKLAKLESICIVQNIYRTREAESVLFSRRKDSVFARVLWKKKAPSVFVPPSVACLLFFLVGVFSLKLYVKV